MKQHSRGAIPSGLCKLNVPRRSEGAGNAGRRCTRGLVCSKAQENAHELVTGTTEHVRHSPRDVWRLIPCSPRRTGRLSHRRPRGVSGRRPTSPFRELDTSIGVSGPHGFVGCVTRASSLRADSVHRSPPHVSW